MIINIVKEKNLELVASIDTKSGEVILQNGYDVCDLKEFLIKKNGKAYGSNGFKQVNLAKEEI